MGAADFARELECARALAREAGRVAMRFYGNVSAGCGRDGPVTEADRASNRVILAGLRAEFPDDAILSEESRDDGLRLDAHRVWIVDPLDGTREFLAQNGEFSVMIGLAVHGRPVVGVVYRPDGDVLYSAAHGAGAWRDEAGTRSRLLRTGPPGSGLRLVGSRSHPDPLLTRMQEALGISDVRPSGSVGIKCALIAESRCDLYIHPVPYLKEWDTCAPEILLREAGGAVTDCLGEPLLYNKADPVQPHGIFAAAPGVHGRALERIRALYTAAGAGERAER